MIASLGSKIWPGLGKFVEEASEALVICGKLLATHGNVEYWEGINLKNELEDEIADVCATITFLAVKNDLDLDKIEARILKKLALYEQWAKDENTPK